MAQMPQLRLKISPEYFHLFESSIKGIEKDAASCKLMYYRVTVR